MSANTCWSSYQSRNKLMDATPLPCSILKNNLLYWEFTYAAPVEFSHAPPWWLLIEKPELWPNGMDDWEIVFNHRLKTFLRAMKSREDTEIQKGHIKENQRMSSHMQRSWDSGNFWIVYAALNSFAFDAIYWKKN
ncbi:hypothetical protein ACN38_g10349 [Penicillium nordicum]|uniref:Uncharacterized protein n=1 Tax=Penicillium nordicum TaxID=229535 RepID=A0A0M9WBP5_9EURO|nr:hypothetical protein ACN38_g10349 [Penicillium nordicum]